MRQVLVVLALLVPSVLGCLMGLRLGRWLEPTSPEPGGVLCSLRRATDASGLAVLPLWARLGVSAMIVLSLVSLLGQFGGWAK